MITIVFSPVSEGVVYQQKASRVNKVAQSRLEVDNQSEERDRALNPCRENSLDPKLASRSVSTCPGIEPRQIELRPSRIRKCYSIWEAALYLYLSRLSRTRCERVTFLGVSSGTATHDVF